MIAGGSKLFSLRKRRKNHRQTIIEVGNSYRQAQDEACIFEVDKEGFEDRVVQLSKQDLNKKIQA